MQFRHCELAEVAGDNPWAADSLEWATSSPPPDYNFLYLPTVSGRYALWSQTDKTPIVYGLSTQKRETLVTSVIAANPELRFDVPGTSIWPFMVALATAEGFYRRDIYTVGIPDWSSAGICCVSWLVLRGS
jgi:cytochrome c oxidase subunit 1